MRRVSVIATGGTIVSANCGSGASPDAARTSDLLESVRARLAELGMGCSLRRPFGDAGFDSSDIGPEQWRALARCASDEISAGSRGIIIMHGTDTMAYTSAWLSLCFDGTNVPIILTGSQRTPDAPDFDGLRNLFDAAEAVSKGLAGVWICFNGRLFGGGSAHKAHALDFDAYVPRGAKSLSLAELPARSLPEQSAAPRLNLRSVPEPAVSCLVVQPGMAPLLSGDERIVIVSGFGAGNVPHHVREYISKRYESREKPLIIACSQAELGDKAPLAYDGVGLGSLARDGFAVWSQGERPLEFIAALAFFALSGDSAPEEALSRYLQRIVIK